MIAPLSPLRSEANDSAPIPRAGWAGRDRQTPPTAGAAVRIRQVFGLARESRLPPVDAAALARYGQHLEARLVFPLVAGVVDSFEGGLLVDRATVTHLMLEKPTGRTGLECSVLACGGAVHIPLGDLRPHDPAQRQLIDDYRLWLSSCRT